MKTAAIAALAVCATLLSVASPAGALPAAPKPAGVESSVLVPIADGCRRGFHYSWRWRRCVRNWGW